MYAVLHRVYNTKKLRFYRLVCSILYRFSLICTKKKYLQFNANVPAIDF